MEQAAIKSGAMGPLDRRQQGPYGTSSQPVAGDKMPQGATANENKGGPATPAPPHGAGDGQRNKNNTTLVGGGVAEVRNSGGDGLGATVVAGAGSGTGTAMATSADGSPPQNSGDSLEQIYQSTRTWCRTLRRCPNAMEVLISFASKNPRPQSGILFNQYLSDLTGIMYRRLSTTVEEEVGE